jgi:hypothetical protein
MPLNPLEGIFEDAEIFGLSSMLSKSLPTGFKFAISACFKTAAHPLIP